MVKTALCAECGYADGIVNGSSVCKICQIWGDEIDVAKEDHEATPIPPESSADFHMHSTASDGSLSPGELVKLLSTSGIEIASVTDHDTLAGVKEAMQVGSQLGVQIIPGVEISAETEAGESVHILAYFSPAFWETISLAKINATLRRIKDAREERVKIILDKLAKVDIQLEMCDVLKVAGDDGLLGRPHIARALVDKGVVSSMSEAFSKYLRDGGPAHAPYAHSLSPAEAVRIIHESGGFSVLAHPWSLSEPLSIIRSAAKAGLNGMEVYRDPEKAKFFGEIADEYTLVKLGGSDFHGIQGHSAGGVSPGGFPMPSAAVTTFLGKAQGVWKAALEKELKAFARREVSLVASRQEDTWSISACIPEKEKALVFRVARKVGLVQIQPPSGVSQSIIAFKRAPQASFHSGKGEKPSPGKDQLKKIVKTGKRPRKWKKGCEGDKVFDLKRRQQTDLRPGH